ncbi:MAG TPA: relaxase domain-containing protein, partial [Roseomonas sp.]
MKITITPLSNSAAAKGYYDVVSAATRGGAVAREHYVSSPPRMLEVGLDGTLRITILRPGEVSLALDGISPRDGRAIASNPCRPRRSATDVTINLDKTISTFRRAAILAGNYVIVSLIEEAIAQTVASLWLHVQSLRLVLARAGAGGLDLQPSLSIYILDLPHPVSRSDDPQDHRHNLLLNAGHHPGRGLSTIEASLLVQNKLYLEFCLCSELAGRLRTAGIPCEVSGPARLSISGIPHTVTQMWSTRRSEILLASSGLAVGAAPAGQAPHPFTDLAANRFATRRRREARDRAARTTRREKAALPDEVALRRRHCDDLASLNLTPLDLVKGVMNSALGDHPTLGLPDSLALFERSSVASTRTVRTHVASVSCLLGLSMVEINEATHQLIKELTLLGVDRGGEAYFSTPSIIEDERQVHRLLRTSSPAPRQREDLRVGPGDQARAETLARPPQGGADGSPLTSSPRTTIIPIASWNDASQFLGRCAAGVPPAAGSLVVLSSTGNLGRSGVVDIAKACSRHSLTLDTGGAGGSYQSYVSVLDAWRSPDKVDRFATPVIPWQQRAQAHLIAHDAPALLAEYADHGQWISPGAGSDTIEQMAGDFVSRATEGTRPLLLAEEHEAVHRLNSLVRVALSHRGLLDARSTAIETWHLCGNAFERRQMELCPGEPIIVWPEGQERRSWPQTGRL